MVSEEIENIAHPSAYNRWGKRGQVLHPKKGQYWLVKLPSEKKIEEIRHEVRIKGISVTKDMGRIVEHETT